MLDRAAQFGEDMKLELETHTIDPHQFLGIELNPRAASIAELVLWIGYLQWHFKIHGQRTPPEPILRAFKNIECRDAVLEYDGEPMPARDEAGNIITVWDRRSQKTDLVTGRNVPDETKRVPLLTYSNPRPAIWPEADYIVGNPPFIGKVKLREDLGDGYAETLRSAYPDVPDSADFVLYWWHKAAALVRSGKARRFGLITTNSLRQTFARRVVQMHLNVGVPPSGGPRSVVPPLGGSEKNRLKPGLQNQNQPLSLVFAIPDHPWVDTAEGAAVRIAMTVGVAGKHEGDLLDVIDEQPHDDGSAVVTFAPAKRGRIAADLSVGADVTGVYPLQSNLGLSSNGVMLGGQGFLVPPESPITRTDRLIRPIRNGNDLLKSPRRARVIDFYGMTADEARATAPDAFQQILTTVKVERDTNRRDSRRLNWWLFGEVMPQMRRMVAGLTRYIATVETAKHRIFSFLDSIILPEHKLVIFGTEDAFHLGVLSSRIHVVYSLAAGGWLGVGNDPVYSKTRCFDPFPFPLCNEEEQERIRKPAEELDAHRKRVQAQHPDLTLTGLYNVLEKLRSAAPPSDDPCSVVPPLGGSGGTDEPAQAGTTKQNPVTLTPKERDIHNRGLVSILKQLHDDLDAAVFAAYGWPTNLTDAEILTRLVALNAERAAEEKRGIIHWLRPEYQNKPGKDTSTQDTLDLPEKNRGKKSEVRSQKSAKGSTKPTAKTPWPKSLADRIRATEQALHAAKTPVTAADLTKNFSRAKPHDIQEILESLVTLGRARMEGERFSA